MKPLCACSLNISVTLARLSPLVRLAPRDTPAGAVRIFHL